MRRLLVLSSAFFVAALATRSPLFDSLGLALLPRIIGFAFVLFIPGALMLVILNSEGLGVTRTILYSVGLSISLVMFVGGLMSVALPPLGFQQPISGSYVTLVLLSLTGLMIVVSFSRIKTNVGRKRPTLPKFIDRKFLLPAALPFISVLGADLVNLAGNPTVLFLLLALISIIVVDIVIHPPKSSALYPFAISMISLSLLLHTSLITNQLVGWDIHTEYYYYNATRQDRVWDPSTRSNVNAMLSVTVFPAFVSIFSALDGPLLFKITFPFVFFLVPVGLFEFLSRYFNRNISFISSFLFMSFYTFFKEMTWLARQEVAELFLVLLLLLMTEGILTRPKKSLLSLIFGFSLIISHYSLGILISFVLPLTLVLPYFMTPRRRIAPAPFSWGFVTFFLVVAMTWYTFAGDSSIMSNAAHVAERIYAATVDDFFGREGRDPASSAVLNSPWLGLSIWRRISWIVHVGLQLFIVSGFLAVLYSLARGKPTIDPKYVVLSTSAIVLMVLSVILPFFAPSLNMSRIYHFSLMFVAPLCVTGWRTLSKLGQRLSRFSGVPWHINGETLAFASTFVVIFFLFDTGFVYGIVGDSPTSFALGNPIQDPKFSDSESVAVRWLDSGVSDHTVFVYGDYYGSLLLYEHYPRSQVRTFTDQTGWVNQRACVFLRDINSQDRLVLVKETAGWQYASLSGSTFERVGLVPRGRVYSNGGAEVLC